MGTLQLIKAGKTLLYTTYLEGMRIAISNERIDKPAIRTALDTELDSYLKDISLIGEKSLRIIEDALVNYVCDLKEVKRL